MYCRDADVGVTVDKRPEAGIIGMLNASQDAIFEKKKKKKFKKKKKKKSVR
jgi:hypothetical protein